MRITFKNLTSIYHQNTPFEHLALNDISTTFEEGVYYGIIGHTGSGQIDDDPDKTADDLSSSPMTLSIRMKGKKGIEIHAPLLYEGRHGLTDAIERIAKPLKVFKVPVHEIALMMSISLRFIPTLMDETEKIIKAQSARGSTFMTGSLMSRLQALTPCSTGSGRTRSPHTS